MNQDVLDFLDQRRSLPSRLLGEPAPDETTLLRLLNTAVRVPDHGKLTPWRFVRIQGEARRRMGECLAEIHAREHPDAPPHALDKERGRFSHAPLVVVVVGRIVHGHRVPECEQRASGAAVCFQLLLAAQAQGFAGQWLTGWSSYHPDVHRHLGLAGNEEVLGFIHIGTPQGELPDRERPAAATLLTDAPA